MKHSRALGCYAQVVEKWNAFAKVRIDLFGWIDIVAVHPEGRIVGIQTTTSSNAMARLAKARTCPALASWLHAGGELHLHGWKKVKNKWTLVVDRHLTVEDVE